jgi:single-strand DNA-binding protein
VAVEGRIQVRTYEAKDGGRRWVTEVIAEQVRFLDRRGQGQEQQQGQATQIGEEVEFDNSEIPF